jgi:hypothetical protein
MLFPMLNAIMPSVFDLNIVAVCSADCCYCYADRCRAPLLTIVMLNVNMLNATLLSVIMPNVI